MNTNSGLKGEIIGGLQQLGAAKTLKRSTGERSLPPMVDPDESMYGQGERPGRYQGPTEASLKATREIEAMRLLTRSMLAMSNPSASGQSEQPVGESVAI